MGLPWTLREQEFVRVSTVPNPAEVTQSMLVSSLSPSHGFS